MGNIFSTEATTEPITYPYPYPYPNPTSVSTHEPDYSLQFAPLNDYKALKTTYYTEVPPIQTISKQFSEFINTFIPGTNTIGPMGPQGPVGPIGPQGPRGIEGTQGPQGPQGRQGPQGPLGPRGLTGDDGPQGPMGPQGLVGENGPMGPMGPRGAQGPTGFDGIMGQTGIRGLQGLDGPQGPQGPQGLDGMPGLLGPQGPIGMAGPIGLTGPEGLMGPPGITGPIGPKGLTGPQGQSQDMSNYVTNFFAKTRYCSAVLYGQTIQPIPLNSLTELTTYWTGGNNVATGCMSVPSPGRIQVSAPGRYFYTLKFVWDNNNNSGEKIIYLKKSGYLYYNVTTNTVYANNYPTSTHKINGYVDLVAGDYLSFYCLITGSPQPTTNITSNSTFTLTRVT